MHSNASDFLHRCPASSSSREDPHGLVWTLLQWIVTHGWLWILFFASLGFFRVVDGLEHFVDGFPQDNNLGAYLLEKEIEIHNLPENK
jgi:hypothetical protein